jgi:hypothetical protein
VSEQDKIVAALEAVDASEGLKRLFSGQRQLTDEELAEILTPEELELLLAVRPPLEPPGAEGSEA